MSRTGLYYEGPYKRRSRLKLSTELLKVSRRLRTPKFQKFFGETLLALERWGYIFMHLPRFFNRISIRKFGRCKALPRVL